MDVYADKMEKIPSKGGLKDMNKKQPIVWPWSPFAIAALGTGGAAVLLILRVTLMPLLRDVDTGRFATNLPAMLFAAAVLIAMAVPAFYAPRERVDVPASRALPTALAAMLAGGLLGAVALYDGSRYLFGRILPPPGQMQMNTLTQLILTGLLAFGVLGAVALVVWGGKVAAEGGTRRGMSAFAALAPVLWLWCRLAWYEMSYASTVGWSEKFYDFLMVIFELLFLFKLARFVSGIGKTSTGEMLFFSMATVMFALSGPLTRVGLYFTGGAEAYLASNLAGFADFGVGLLALAFGWSLVRGCRENSPTAAKQEEVWLEEDDAPYDSSLESLFVLEENEASEYNQL